VGKGGERGSLSKGRKNIYKGGRGGGIPHGGYSITMRILSMKKKGEEVSSGPQSGEEGLLGGRGGGGFLYIRVTV